MTDYSKYMTFEEFKEELLKSKFFCRTNERKNGKIVYEKRDTDKTITDSYFYKTVKRLLINNNLPIKDCNLDNIYRGRKGDDLRNFNRNFLIDMFKEAIVAKDIKGVNFSLSFRNVFEVIFEYPKTTVMEMYSYDDLLALEKAVTEEHKLGLNNYVFIWDNEGYSFGRVQLNVNSNSPHNGLLKEIGFNDEEYKNITVEFSKGYTKDQLKTSSVAKKLTAKAAPYNKTLQDHRDEIDEYCANHLYSRAKGFLKYNCNFKDVKLKNDVVFILLVDYDNQLIINNLSEKTINSNNDKKSLHKFLCNKMRDDKNYVFGPEEFKEFKSTLKHGKDNKSDSDKRIDRIVAECRPTKENVTIEEAFGLITKEILFNAVSINEVAFRSHGLKVRDVTVEYNKKINDIIIANDITTPDVKITKNGKTGNKTDEIVDQLNSALDIPDISDDKSIFNIYDINRMVLTTDKLIDGFTRKYPNSNANKTLQKFEELKKRTNNLSTYLDKTSKELDTITGEVAGIIVAYEEDKKDVEYSELSIVSSYMSSLNKAYKNMMKDEFAKTNLMITGTISEVNSFLFQSDTAMTEFADSFLSAKPQSEKETPKKPNALSYFYKNSKFLYLKELDYRNLEAYLRKSNARPSELDRRKVWILVYIILILIAKKNKVSDKKYFTEEDNLMDKVSTLVSRMREQKWKYEYSESLKDFSNMYPFVRYKDNPFTSFMQDKGFNESQANAKELREVIENETKKIVDSIKEFVYGENKIYDIFQGLADIAYELSTPMTLYTDFDFMNAGESIINQFLNACVSSLEMQTAMTIYDFLFNFSIKIGKESYSLNDLNNMLKMFNLIIESTKADALIRDITSRTELAKNTTEYRIYKQIGFFTYNKRWKIKQEEIPSAKLGEFTGYYLSDEPMLYDIVEYCRHKGAMCEAGDLKTLTSRFMGLNYYEWISAFACHKILENGNKYSSHFTYAKMLSTVGSGYLQIEEFYRTFEAEANNTNASITHINPMLNELINEIVADRASLDDFINKQRLGFFKFQTNLKKNEETATKMISSNMSDNKIYDWMMKMLPTYQMIAEAFGFADLNGIKTLEDFIGGLMNSLNIIIKVTFDKWKNETIETIKVRRIQLIEKERYYYIQAFPVLIDWVVKNLEFYLTAFNEVVSPNTSIDSQKYDENMKNMETVIEDFIIKLKKELSTLEKSQIDEIEKAIKESVAVVEDLNAEQLKELLNSLNGLDDISKLIKDLFKKKEEQSKEEPKKEEPKKEENTDKK